MAPMAGPTPPVVAVFVKFRLRRVKPLPLEVPKLIVPAELVDEITTWLSDMAVAVGPAMVTVWEPVTVTAEYVPARTETVGTPGFWA